MPEGEVDSLKNKELIELAKKTVDGIENSLKMQREQVELAKSLVGSISKSNKENLFYTRATITFAALAIFIAIEQVIFTIIPLPDSLLARTVLLFFALGAFHVLTKDLIKLKDK